LLSELFGWRSIFFVTAGAVLTIPYTIKALPKFEQRIVGSLDLLGGMSFPIMGANLASLVGLPILLALAHHLSPLEIGLVMLPGAVLSAGSGVLAGRLTDRVGARLPIRIGTPAMLIALFGLSVYAESSPWTIAIFSGLLGAGFGFVNTPLAATISRLVRGEMLASALSMNSMLFFLGGSFGTAVLMALVTSNGPDGASLNPLHTGAANGFSDGFLLLMIPVLVALGLSLALPSIVKPEVSNDEPTVETLTVMKWTPNCSVPWHPKCVEILATDPVSATR
jgi:MFS family permease